MKSKQPKKSSPTFANPEMQQIEQLFQFMTEHNLEEFEYSRGDLHIRLRKPSSGMVIATPRTAAAPEIIVSNPRSEERRVGKECRAWETPDDAKKTSIE